MEWVKKDTADCLWKLNSVHMLWILQMYSGEDTDLRTWIWNNIFTNFMLFNTLTLGNFLGSKGFLVSYEWNFMHAVENKLQFSHTF